MAHPIFHFIFLVGTQAKETNRTFNSAKLLETKRAVVAQNTEEPEIRYFSTYTRSNLNYTGAKKAWAAIALLYTRLCRSLLFAEHNFGIRTAKLKNRFCFDDHPLPFALQLRHFLRKGQEDKCY